MEREIKPPEREPELLQAYARRFITRRDRYALQRADGQGYTQKAAALTLRLVAAHVRGELTLGAYALDAQSRAHWLCLDADDAAQFETLMAAAGQLTQQGIPTYLERSRRGGHWWWFFSPLSGKDARRLGQQVIQRFGLPPDLEVYPKQDRLTSGPGSLVRLPLGIHRKSGQRYPFITPEGQPLAATLQSQLRQLAAAESVPPAYIDDLLASAPALESPLPTPRFEGLAVGQGETLSEVLKSRISVLDFVSQYVALDATHTGFCPFHEDQEKSFGVNVDGNYWHCFAGCGGGSLIDFWMRWRAKHGEDGSFSATVRDLRQRLL